MYMYVFTMRLRRRESEWRNAFMGPFIKKGVKPLSPETSWFKDWTYWSLCFIRFGNNASAIADTGVIIRTRSTLSNTSCINRRIATNI